MIADPNPQREAGADLTFDFAVKGAIEPSKPVADEMQGDDGAELSSLPEVPQSTEPSVRQQASSNDGKFKPTFEESRRFFESRLGVSLPPNNKAMVRCPFHDDNSPSLSLDLPKGLWHCFACSIGGGLIDFERKLTGRADSVCWGAIESTIGRSITRVTRPQQPDIQEVYPYHDAAGKLLYEVVRLSPKGFRMRRPDGDGGYLWNMAGVVRVPFNLSELVTSNIALIGEGERDAINLQKAAAHFPNEGGTLRYAATTSVGGAGKWADDYSPYFVGREVFVSSDNDDAGRYHAQQVCASVSKLAKAQAVHLVELPGLPPKGDVTDYLRDHTPAELFAQMKSAPRWTPPPEILADRSPDLLCLADVKAEPVPWLWRGYLAYGMLAMLSGDPDAGKTFIALAISASLSNGRVPVTGEICEPVTTLYLSQENSAQHVIRPRFDALGGDASRFLLLTKPGFTLRDIDALEKALTQTAARLVVIDPIQSFLGSDVDAHRSNETRPVMDGLIRLAEKFGACILLVRHLTKASGGRAIHRGLGSIDLTGAVRLEMIAGTAAADPNRRALVPIKNNVGPRADSLGYEIVGAEMDARLEWCGKSDLTADDVLAAASEADGRSEIAEAVDFVRDQLATGPKLQKDLQIGSGIPERTLQRAAQKVGVKRSRAGQKGSWVWALPDHTRQQTVYPTTQAVVAHAESGRLCSPPAALPFNEGLCTTQCEPGKSEQIGGQTSEFIEVEA